MLTINLTKEQVTKITDSLDDLNKGWMHYGEGELERLNRKVNTLQDIIETVFEDLMPKD